MRKLIYISHWRFPAEKTHAAFAMKTCEMFAKKGIMVELWASWRRNKLKGSDPFAYHGVEKLFIIRRLPVLDLTGLVPGNSAFFLLLATFNIVLFFYAFLRRLPKDTIFYFHDVRDALLFSFVGVPKFLEIHDFYKSGADFINRLVFPRTSGFIVTTRFKMQVLEKEFGVLPEKMLYQPNAVDIDLFDVAVTQEEARRKLNLPQDKKIILYTGSLFLWKGADILLAAADFLSENEMTCFVGGTDDDIKEFKVKSLKSKVKNIIVVGRRPHQEIPLWLKAADVLVLPNTAKDPVSKYETSPVKLFEYMASGRPIIASDLPSVRSIVEETTVTFFEPDNSFDLAAQIKTVLLDYPRLTEKADLAKRKVGKYSWEKRTKTIVDWLKQKA